MNSPFSRALILLLAVLATPLGAGTVYAQTEGAETAGEACSQAQERARCLLDLPASVEGLAAALRSEATWLIERQHVRQAAPLLTRAEELDGRGGSIAMWARHFGNPSVLQPARAARNRARARALLRRDSLDAGANLFLGTQDAREVARRNQRASIPPWLSGEQAVSVLRQGGTRRGLGPGTQMNFRSQDVNMTVSSVPQESRLMRNTVTRLRRALSSPELGPFALRSLALVHLAGKDHAALASDAARLRGMRPDHPDGYLIGALAANQEGRAAAAATLAEMGLDLVPEAHREAMLDPVSVLPPGARPPADWDAWWLEQDPIALTEINERLAEHIARWVYADVRYGDPYNARPGWETDPGKVIVRYGIPVGEIQFTGGDTAAGDDSGWDRFSVFQYEAFDFRFVDLGRSGHWSFYSPRATAYQGARANTEIRAADYVTIARERFRDLPSLITPTWETFGLSIAVFRSGDGFEVLATGSVPPGLEAAQTGALALDAGSRIASVGPQSVAGWEQGGSFFKSLSVPRSRSRGFRARVEAVTAATLASPARTAVLGSPFVEAPVGPGLALSGLVFADLVEEAEGPAAAGFWERGGLHIRPIDGGEVDLDAPLYIFFEAYDLALGSDNTSRYEVTATLTPTGRQGNALTRLFRRGDGSVGAGYQGSGASTEIAEYLLIESDGREPGEYLLTLHLNDRIAQSSVETTSLVRFR